MLKFLRSGQRRHSSLEPIYEKVQYGPKGRPPANLQPIPILENLYGKVIEMDLHRDEGLHGIPELEAILKRVSMDEDFKLLSKLARVREVFFLNRKKDLYGAYYLEISEDGHFQGKKGAAFPEDGERDLIAKGIGEFFSWLFPEDIDSSLLKKGILNYITHVPLGYRPPKLSSS